ncbi:hypothetical protein [Olleya marilimosa]|uniref:hypothetical protein n=1 Tax=Olleya marilimosa TaxID=272164 RepID=UPI0030EC3CF6|tara:strand:+ start:1517 stop:1867 length:351 start_codon:yes stop_codon:yes gene_type:complete
MQTIKRNIGDFDDLHFEVDLTQYGKTGSDINDIHFNVKKDIDSSDFLLQKKQSLTEITFTGTTTVDVYVQWAEDEYDNFNNELTYICGLYLMFSGEPSVDLHADQDFNLIFKKRVI